MYGSQYCEFRTGSWKLSCFYQQVFVDKWTGNETVVSQWSLFKKHSFFTSKPMDFYRNSGGIGNCGIDKQTP